MQRQIIQLSKGDPSKLNPSEPPGWEVIYQIEEDKEVNIPYIIFLGLSLVTIFFAILLKQVKFLRKITEYVPESGCLMVIGVFIYYFLFGISYAMDYFKVKGERMEHYLLAIDHWIIEHFMIAPIILHASYDLYHPHFFGQLGTILALALIATVCNAFIITVFIYFGYNWLVLPGSVPGRMNIFICLTYGALVSAVDPVAVLAVMSAVNADKALYFLVFGESLLNDGVTYVMFEGFKAFTAIPTDKYDQIGPESYMFLALSFITKPFGGIAIGFIMGLFSALVTKHSGENTAFMKPLINLLFAALGYSLALIFAFSGILCLIAYGLTQQRYTFRNISHSAAMNTCNLVRGVAVIMETLLFFYLGTEFASLNFHLVWEFALIVLSTIFVARVVVTFSLTWIINKFRKYTIDWRWQIIIIAGGLRGAIAFAMIVHYEGPYSKLLYDVTVITIFVTTIANGIVAKPLVILLKLQADSSGGKFDYDKHYGWDQRKGCFKYWSWLEENFLFKYFTKEHKHEPHDVAMKEIIENEEEKILEKLDESIHSDSVQGINVISDSKPKTN